MSYFLSYCLRVPGLQGVAINSGKCKQKISGECDGGIRGKAEQQGVNQESGGAPGVRELGSQDSTFGTRPRPLSLARPGPLSELQVLGMGVQVVGRGKPCRSSCYKF